MFKFNRVQVTQEMIERQRATRKSTGEQELNGIYPHSAPGIYVETTDARGWKWYQPEYGPYCSILTCENCGSEFTHAGRYADDPDVCPHCHIQKTRNARMVPVIATPTKTHAAEPKQYLCGCGEPIGECDGNSPYCG